MTPDSSFSLLFLLFSVFALRFADYIRGMLKLILVLMFAGASLAATWFTLTCLTRLTHLPSTKGILCWKGHCVLPCAHPQNCHPAGSLVDEHRHRQAAIVSVRGSQRNSLSPDQWREKGSGALEKLARNKHMPYRSASSNITINYHFMLGTWLFLSAVSQNSWQTELIDSWAITPSGKILSCTRVPLPSVASHASRDSYLLLMNTRLCCGNINSSESILAGIVIQGIIDSGRSPAMSM